MLTALCQQDGQKVLARDSTKSEAPFQCPACRGEVVLIKGKTKPHHFRHKHSAICPRGLEETSVHHSAKLALFDALRMEPNVTETDLEKDLGPVIADLYAVIGGTPVAMEFLRKKLDLADVASRTASYTEAGLCVLWIALPDDRLWKRKYNPNALEKWCHAAYFGRVYYWHEGLWFHVVHFDPIVHWVSERRWFEAGGYENSAGGYERIAKRHKIPNPGQRAQLSRDFRPVDKKAWSGGSVNVPACRLYVDRQPNWWK